ncbi:armadillo-type protein [Mycena galopus ATCC 62051]|nr:armadillo-type protein [Mycena galopus ATCC 62051]
MPNITIKRMVRDQRWIHALDSLRPSSPSVLALSSMPPLTRLESRPSIFSWWSDSNPGLRGPTINLHAAAKPLSRFLYGRQAVEIIRKNLSNPLSQEILEIYSSYFPLDYVSWTTKAAILSELADRTLTSEADARAVVDSPVFPYIAQMLGSPVPRVRSCSRRLLGNLALRESTVWAMSDEKICERLVSLLRDKYPAVIREAASLLCEIAKSADGAQAIVKAKAIDYISTLLRSPSSGVRDSACELVGRLACHQSTGSAILELNPCTQLVSLLRDTDSQWAIKALCQIARWADGLDAIVQAKATDYVLVLLESPNSEVRECTCELIGMLAGCESSAPAILEVEPQLHIVSVLNDEDPKVVRSAMYALSQISRWSDDARATVYVKGADHILTLIESPSSKVREWTCELIGMLAGCESTAAAVLELKPYGLLVTLLSDKNVNIVRAAAFALAQIAQWPDGAKAMVDAEALDRIPILLESPHPYTPGWACAIVAGFATHESTVLDILELDPCARLVSLLYSEDSAVTHAATFALSQIAQWANGAETVVDAKATDRISLLLDSPSSEVREWTCSLIGGLASHESTAPAILELQPCTRMVSLLEDPNSKVIMAATFAFSQIVRWLQGAQGIMDADVLDHVSALLKSPNPHTRQWACELVGRLASHDSTVPAVPGLETCVQLVSLLRDDDVLVIEWATYALCSIVMWPHGAQAIVDPKFIGHILILLRSSSPIVRRQTCRVVRWLAKHESSVRALLRIDVCAPLVSFLLDEDPKVIRRAIFALSEIARWPDGAKDMVDVKVLDHLPALVESPDPYTRKPTCIMVGRLAGHECTAGAILELKPCFQLLSLSRNTDNEADHVTVFAPETISEWGDGVTALSEDVPQEPVTQPRESSTYPRRYCRSVHEVEYYSN